MKCHLEDLVATCDETVNVPDPKLINPNGKTNYLSLVLVLFAIATLLYLVVTVVNYYMKHGLTIPCLLLY